MTSEMVKKDHYDGRDGQKGSLWHQRRTKKLIMVSDMVKMAHYDLRVGQTGSL